MNHYNSFSNLRERKLSAALFHMKKRKLCFPLSAVRVTQDMLALGAVLQNAFTIRLEAPNPFHRPWPP